MLDKTLVTICVNKIEFGPSTNFDFLENELLHKVIFYYVVSLRMINKILNIIKTKDKLILDSN